MDLNRENIKKLVLLIVFAVGLYVLLQNLALAKSYFMRVVWLLFPFLLGSCIAFIINVPMRSIENFFERFLSSQKLVMTFKRPLSLLCAIVFIGLVLFGVIFLIVPEIAKTFRIISAALPTFFNNVQILAINLLAQYPNVVDQILNISFDWREISEKIFSFLQSGASGFLSSTVGVATSIVGSVVNFFLGLVFAIYVLLQKERLSRQAKQILYAFLPEKISDHIIAVGQLSEKTFSNFLSGQCLEAVILGTLFFIAMTLFKFPYPLLVGVLIGFTSLIPIFGAFIGCIIAVFLILITDPIKAFWFLVMFLIIQQIEGNLIYPHVVGGSVGLPSLWVLVAVTLGGSMMGIIGMLIFIPLCSVLYTLIRGDVYQRLRQRGVSASKWR